MAQSVGPRVLTFLVQTRRSSCDNIPKPRNLVVWGHFASVVSLTLWLAFKRFKVSCRWFLALHDFGHPLCDLLESARRTKKYSEVDFPSTAVSFSKIMCTFLLHFFETKWVGLVSTHLVWFLFVCGSRDRLTLDPVQPARSLFCCVPVRGPAMA